MVWGRRVPTWGLVCLIVTSKLWAGCGENIAEWGEQINAAHEAISSDLYHGRVVWAHPFHANGNRHQIFKVGLYNDRTGRTREAFFKPRQWGDAEGWGRTPMEYLAYVLNRKLDMDYIPPVAYRRNLWVDGQHFGEGAMVVAVPDAHLLLDVNPKKWGKPKAAVLSDNRVLCVLLQNPDSIHNNILRGKHWVHGKYRPFFLDFSASLHPGLNVTMTHYPYFRNSDPVYQIRKQTLEALKRLHWNDLQEVKEFINEDEMRAILGRRDGIVAFMEKLISERGWENVVLDY